MSIVQIKSRFDDRVLYECEAESMLDALQKGVKARANLAWANLAWANLSGANLSGANLDRANLDGAYLDGKEPVLDIIQVAGIGSVRRLTTVIVTPTRVLIQCGCFCGDLDEFRDKIEKTHGAKPKYLAQYRAAVAFIEVCVSESRKEKSE